MQNLANGQLTFLIGGEAYTRNICTVARNI